MNKYARWFKCTMWLGIVVNLVLGIPGIFFPTFTLELVGQTTSPADALWISLASMLLVVLSIAYMPGAINPYRYRANAWLAIVSRLHGVIFFLYFNPGLYPMFGILDLIFAIIQTPLLLLTFFSRSSTSYPQESDVDINSPATQSPVFEYDGATFADVKKIAFSGRYQGKLPYHFGLTPWRIVKFFNDASRNLSDRRDYLPRFDKLIHANGICHAGVWRIDQESPYTGFFAKGSQGLCLARLSVGGLFVKSGLFPRAFGVGGKVFPTMDPNQKFKPGNFVAMEHLSGTWAKHFTDVELTNSPSVGLDPLANIINRIIFRLMDTRPGYRKLHPISTLGVPAGDPVVTPDLLMLKVAEDTVKVDERDFRDELRLEYYPPNHKLVYTINVKNFEETGWTRLGTLEFTEYAISEGGDKRIQFWIPRDTPDEI